MATELRKTGISIVGDLPWGAHFCYFYETKQDLLDILIPYFKIGLESREFCLWVISNSELLTVAEATSALRDALPDLDRYVAARSIEVIGHADWFLSGDTFDPHRVANQFKNKLDEALDRGYEGMRVNGSPAWLRDEGEKELRKFEADLHKLFPRERIIASCTYPLESISADEIFDVAQTHQFAIARRQGRWEVLETPELIQAKAEIKGLNEELEGRVIERTNELLLANEALRKEISERKRAEALLLAKEQEFRAIVESAPDHIIRYDREFRRTYVNPAVARDYGLPADSLTGKVIGSVIQDAGIDVKEEELTQLRQRIAAVFETGESSEYEMNWPLPTGRRYYSVRYFPDLDLNGAVINVLGIARDITERKLFEAKLEATSEQLRVLSESLESARDEERKRIAREVHDELGANLSSLRWELEDVDEVISATKDLAQVTALRQKVQGLINLTDITIGVVRRIAWELRPTALGDLGLTEAIEGQARQFQVRTGIICRSENSLEMVALEPEQSTAVFRIFQEAMTNILRHARATKVEINIKEEAGEFELTISDNGRGITEDEQAGAQSLGLIGIRERAHLIGGKIIITGIEGQGTTVSLRIPMSPMS